MAGKAPRLKVIVSVRALKALDEIWDWNARRYDIVHAEEYVEFLKRKIRSVATTYRSGKPVPTAPELRYITIKRRSGGQGHVAVYHVFEGVVEVVNIFHTAQDWQGKVGRDER